MTDNELLLAISDMMDKKLKAELGPMKADIRELQTDMKEVKADVKELQVEMKEVKADVKELQVEMIEVKDNIQSIWVHLENETDKNVQLLVENVVPAAKKYEKEVERIDAIQEDVTIVKEVLQEHSEKLLKMA
jgi:hypothetical protein